MHPVASILIPSRNRPEILKETVRTFFSRADDPSRVEVLVRLHESDTSSLSLVRRYPVRTVAGNDPGSYRDVYKYVNCLAALAEGDWLWCASDRNRVITKGWDTALTRRDAEQCCMLYPGIVGFPAWRVPIVSRALYQVLGHVGLTPHCDCYIDALAGLIGARKPVAIETVQVDCGYAAERNILATWEEYRSEAASRLFAIDKLKLEAACGISLGAWVPRNAPENPWA